MKHSHLEYVCDFTYCDDISKSRSRGKLIKCGLLIPKKCNPSDIYLNYDFNSDEVDSYMDEIIRDLRFNKIEHYLILLLILRRS